MSGYRLTLFGPPRLECPGGPERQLRLGAKPLGLLAFLALEPGPHTRDELATLLWGDSSPEAARASLRQALHAMRQALGELVTIGRDQVALAAEVDCDVGAFRHACRDAPAEAVRFDVPRFLAGFTARHAPGFEEWLEQTRGQLVRAHRDALGEATRSELARSRWREAMGLAERWLECDPLSEAAARYLAEARYMSGDRGGALAVLAAYGRRLHHETGRQPGLEVAALAERIESAGRRRSGIGTNGCDTEPVFETGLLGRESEWRILLEVWSEVRAGRNRIVLIEGEPGVGKTRLASDFLQWCTAEGGTVLRGSGFDPEESVPYAPIVEVLGQAASAPGVAGVAPEWLAEAARLHPGIRDRFPDLPDASAPGDTDRRWRLFESVAQVLREIAVERPTVLFIDDLQLCDTATCAFLHFLQRRVEAARILLLATVTLGDLERSAPASRLCRAVRSEPRARVVTMHPLSPQAVWELIRDLGRLTHPDDGRRFAARIHAVTDGNPFHIVELLKTLFAQGMLTVDGGTGAWTVTPAAAADLSETIDLPRTVREAITARFSKLPYELRDLLVAVAVAGRGATTALLSLVSGASRLRVAALADSLVERRLLAEESGVYRCAHPVIGEVIREAVTPARRREMHRALAYAFEELGEQGLWGEAARHAMAGAEPERAYRTARRAAEWTLERQSAEDAVAWLDVALKAASTDADRAAAAARRAELVSMITAAPAAQPTRRSGTPARGLARKDLDLGTPQR